MTKNAQSIDPSSDVSSEPVPFTAILNFEAEKEPLFIPIGSADLDPYDPSSDISDQDFG